MRIRSTEKRETKHLRRFTHGGSSFFLSFFPAFLPSFQLSFFHSCIPLGRPYLPHYGTHLLRSIATILNRIGSSGTTIGFITAPAQPTQKRLEWSYIRS